MGRCWRTMNHAWLKATYCMKARTRQDCCCSIVGCCASRNCLRRSSDFQKQFRIVRPFICFAKLKPRASLPGRSSVSVRAFGGLAVQAAAEVGADFIVKGLRTPNDFDIEQQMAHTNHSVTGIRTVFVPCRSDLGFISSRFIREIAAHGETIEHLVAAPVAAALADRFARPSPE